MRSRCLPVMALAVLSLAACARPHTRTVQPLPPRVLQYPVEDPQPTQAQAVPVTVPVAQGGPFAPEPPYMLDSGDRLRIVVFGQQNLTNTYSVDASGKIAMPLIGSVPARGLTPQQLAQSIAASLRRGFMRDPSVSAEVVTYRPFFILGEVNNPGQYPYVAHMTVETAVAIAGGYGPRGSKRDVIISRTVRGVMTKFKAPINFQIQPGDTVRVKERWF
ncbi:MAG: polysaccharide export protein [Rhizobiales bacterium]|nr:polysaccharide export protein [Hyphomicrobiales bacterium]